MLKKNKNKKKWKTCTTQFSIFSVFIFSVIYLKEVGLGDFPVKLGGFPESVEPVSMSYPYPEGADKRS